MRKIPLEELRTVQLNILNSVDKFCKESGIKYSLSGGTLLGAIRHGGYIPWDDDIDICMLREDYIRFEREFPQVYDGHLRLASLKRRKDWTLSFAKVYDDRTIGYLKSSSSVSPGVNIDIFPMDDVPDNDEEWHQYNHKRRALLVDLRRSGSKISFANSFWKNCGIILFNLRYCCTNRRKLAEKVDSYIQVHNEKGYSRIFETSMGMAMKNTPLQKALFNHIIDIPFEKRLYKTFKNYDEYLTCVFGDYMTPPPPEKRISFHAIDFYWKD